MKSYDVTIIHKGSEQRLSVRQGSGFQAVAVRCQTPLEFDCREADCGICIFRVVAGMENLNPPKLKERDFLKAMRADPSERLACQTQILGNVTIELEDFGP